MMNDKINVLSIEYHKSGEMSIYFENLKSFANFKRVLYENEIEIDKENCNVTDDCGMNIVTLSIDPKQFYSKFDFILSFAIKCQVEMFTKLSTVIDTLNDNFFIK